MAAVVSRLLVWFLSWSVNLSSWRVVEYCARKANCSNLILWPIADVNLRRRMFSETLDIDDSKAMGQ